MTPTFCTKLFENDQLHFVCIPMRVISNAPCAFLLYVNETMINEHQFVGRCICEVVEQMNKLCCAFGGVSVQSSLLLLFIFLLFFGLYHKFSPCTFGSFTSYLSPLFSEYSVYSFSCSVCASN